MTVCRLARPLAAWLSVLEAGVVAGTLARQALPHLSAVRGRS
jgi:hypothetical protein